MSPSVLLPDPTVPAETFQAARKVYNIHHVYLRIGDHLHAILERIDSSLLDPTLRLSGDTVLRLALVTAFQYSESLPDPLASEATMKRMDWKYALCLPLQFPGIPETTLCAFRQNLFFVPTGLNEFSRLARRLGEAGLFGHAGQGLPNPVDLLSAICQVTRLYRLNLAMKAALGALAVLAPEWVRSKAPAHWYERYKTGRLARAYDHTTDDLEKEAARLGADVEQILRAVQQLDEPELTGANEIHQLRLLFEHQYFNSNGAIGWRLPECATCSYHSMEAHSSHP